MSQFSSPIILILLFAAGLSLYLRDVLDSAIILVIVFISGLLGFWQEYNAANAVEKLLAIVEVKASVIRNGAKVEIPLDEVVHGDVVVLSAGDVIPGDCRILDSKDLFVDQAVLMGETFPAEKEPGILPEDTPLARRSNALFLGTHVISGTARAVVVATGTDTEFGKVSERLAYRAPETNFERGVRHFGYFLMEVTLLLVLAIFALNVYLHRPVLESMLFSLALAVGLTPQLLPAIITVNLSHGARRIAEHRVIVKRLAAIENLGSMNVLCTDKTGTLTEGTVQMHAALDAEEKASEKVLLYAYINAAFESGYANPVDEAIRRHKAFDLSDWEKLDEIPYDFVRKRLSVLASTGSRTVLIVKGALDNVLACCSTVEFADGKVMQLDAAAASIRQRFEDYSIQGFRVLGVACKAMDGRPAISKADEKDLVFLGFLLFHDPPKSGIIEVVGRLKMLGISLKILTGDNQHVSRALSEQIGLKEPQILTGSTLRDMSDEALLRVANDIDIYAEVEPNQKERIILALRKAGNIVGYMGDGVNDASALHAADASISVDSAVDVARETADIVLLEKDLGVLEKGVRSGRETFANTLKYVFMATSANFGNMFSMAGASLFLPFLPLLPKQILLTNLLTDLPEMTIATDNVDREMVEKPQRWDIRFIRRFMLVFGILSSVFDYLTFGVLLWLLRAPESLFQTGWFTESVISASMIVLVVRSRRAFVRSRPGKYLVGATLLITIMTIIFPWTPLGGPMGFSPLPLTFVLLMSLIVFLYILSAEVAKRHFYKAAQP